MARRDAEDLMSRLRQAGEEGVSSLLGEVFDNQRIREGLGRAGKKILANKRSFDDNVESVLEFVNLPSKKDVRELKVRLDHLGSQIVNLSIKVDRLLAKQTPTSAGETPKRAGRRGPGKPAE